MNARQMAQQIRAVLAAATWPESGGELVFGDRQVYVVAGAPDDKELPPSAPFALVHLGVGTADPDDPNLIAQEFTVLTVSDVPGGRMGEAALVGGSKSSGGSSANRGVLELNDRVRAALKDLRGADGANLFLHTSATGAPIRLGAGRHAAVGETRFSGWVTAEPEFEPPSRFALSGSTWSWDGSACEARFDFVQYRFGYKNGSVPASSPDDPGFVTLETPTSSPYVRNPGAGLAYSIFAEYSQRGRADFLDGSSRGDEIGAFLLT